MENKLATRLGFRALAVWFEKPWSVALPMIIGLVILSPIFMGLFPYIWFSLSHIRSGAGSNHVSSILGSGGPAAPLGNSGVTEGPPSAI